MIHRIINERSTFCSVLTPFTADYLPHILYSRSPAHTQQAAASAPSTFRLFRSPDDTSCSRWCFISQHSSVISLSLARSLSGGACQTLESWKTQWPPQGRWLRAPWKTACSWCASTTPQPGSPQTRAPPGCSYWWRPWSLQWLQTRCLPRVAPLPLKQTRAGPGRCGSGSHCCVWCWAITESSWDPAATGLGR